MITLKETRDFVTIEQWEKTGLLSDLSGSSSELVTNWLNEVKECVFIERGGIDEEIEMLSLLYPMVRRLYGMIMEDECSQEILSMVTISQFIKDSFRILNLINMKNFISTFESINVEIELMILIIKNYFYFLKKYIKSELRKQNDNKRIAN